MNEQNSYISIFDRPVDEERIHALAFWHKQWDKEKFIQGFIAGERGWLQPALEHLSPMEVAGLLGRRAVSQAWPKVRERALEYQPDQKVIAQWDNLWSLATTGTLGVVPKPGWDKLTRRDRDFLAMVSKHPQITTYQASKRLKMPYCRGLEHRNKLLKGWIKQTRIKTGKRIGLGLSLDQSGARAN